MRKQGREGREGEKVGKLSPPPRDMVNAGSESMETMEENEVECMDKL